MLHTPLYPHPSSTALGLAPAERWQVSSRHRQPLALPVSHGHTPYTGGQAELSIPLKYIPSHVYVTAMKLANIEHASLLHLLHEDDAHQQQ